MDLIKTRPPIHPFLILIQISKSNNHFNCQINIDTECPENFVLST